MRKLISFAIAVAAISFLALTAQAANSLKNGIFGRSFCYTNGQKITFNTDGTLSNDFGKTRRWSVNKDGTSITYSGPGFSHTVPTTIDASGILKETNPSSGQTNTANPC
jgi:hypothetical protein